MYIHHRKSKYEQCKCKVPRHRAVVVTKCKGAQGQVDRSMCTHNCNFKQHRETFITYQLSRLPPPSW